VDALGALYEPVKVPVRFGKAPAAHGVHIAFVTGRAALNEKAVMFAIVFINAARNEIFDIYNDFRVFAGNVGFANFGGRGLHGVSFGRRVVNNLRNEVTLSGKFHSLFTLYS